MNWPKSDDTEIRVWQPKDNRHGDISIGSTMMTAPDSAPRASWNGGADLFDRGHLELRPGCNCAGRSEPAAPTAYLACPLLNRFRDQG